MMSVTNIKTDIPTPNRNRFRNNACQQDTDDEIVDDEEPCIIEDDGRGNTAPDAIRPMGDLMISPTDDDGSRVGTDWYTELEDDDDGADNDDDDAKGKLQIAVAATVGFFIIPQSITVVSHIQNKRTMQVVV